MKVINPRGIEIVIPDEWKGPKLNQLLEEGYKLVEKTVVIGESKPVEVQAVVQDVVEMPDEQPVELDLPEVPAHKLRVLGKDGRLTRLPGHGKYVSHRFRKEFKQKKMELNKELNKEVDKEVNNGKGN